MTTTVYTLGYSGRTPGNIKALAEKYDADIFDIRFSPRSRVPFWNGGPLTRFLGERYHHVKSFGNVNYKSGGPIALVDYETGRQAISDNPRPVILMCACGNSLECHRTTIARMLQSDGFNVKEFGQQPLPW